MKHASILSAAAIACLLAAECAAAVFTHNASARPGLNPDAGTVNAWLVTLTSGDSGQNGDFQGNSAGNGDGNGAGAGANAWAMYANSGQTARATTTAFNTLSDVSALNMAGQFLSLDFDNGFIDTGGSVGVTFRDSSNNEQFTFRFLGGSPNYRYTDATNNDTPTTKGFTDDGFNINMLLTNGSGGYQFTAGTTTISGTLKQNSSTIASVQVFNSFAGGGSERNVYFDHLRISTAAIPEVSAALAIPVAVIMTGLCASFCRQWQRASAA
jgi:hypothetical protein